MSNIQRALWIGFCVTVSGSVLLSCGSSHRLHEVQFRDRRASVFMAAAPRPDVFTGGFVWVDKDDPVGSILRAGTTIAKEVEAGRVRARLDSAMREVDVPERLRDGVLYGCSELLALDPVPDARDADFTFHLNLREYGIEAKSWTTGTFFKIDLDVSLIDNTRELRVWKKRFKERMPVSPEYFGLDQSIDNVITAVALSRLTVEQMAAGFEQLADVTADRLTARLQRDYVESREVD